MQNPSSSYSEIPPSLFYFIRQREKGGIVSLIMMKRAYTAYEYFKELGGDLRDTFADGVPIGLVGT